MVIEQEFLAEQLEKRADQEEKIRRIAGVNDVETLPPAHVQRERERANERDGILDRVAGDGRCFEQAIAVDIDAVDGFDLALVALAGRRDDGNAVAGIAQGRGFLPDPPVERDRQVFDQDQHPPGALGGPAGRRCWSAERSHGCKRMPGLLDVRRPAQPAGP